MMQRFSALLCLVLFSLILQAPASFAQNNDATFAAAYDEAASEYQRGNMRKAATLWQTLATQGDANSQYALAIMHLKKEIQKPSDTIAFTYLSSAAKDQHLAAMFNLGVAYWEGKGTLKQTAKALNWWEIAAQRQDAGAQYNLGLAYYIGEGRTQDIDKAVYWIEQAADNNHPQAAKLIADIKSGTLPQASIATTPQASSVITKKNASSNAPKIRKNAKTQKITSSQKPAKKIIVKEPAQTLSTGSRHTIQSLSALRARPNATAARVSSLKAGDDVKILSALPKWSKVLPTKSYAVWVFNKFIRDQGNGLGAIQGTNVNIRPKPSTDNRSAPPLGVLNNGEKVAIVLKRDGWTQIIPQKAFPAWVSNTAFGQ